MRLLQQRYGLTLLTEHSLTVRLRIGKWYAKNLLVIEPGFNAHLERWNSEDNECTATFTCFDDYPYPPYRRNKEQLEEYVVRRFGSMIIEGKRRSRQLALSSASKGIPLTHPIVKKDKKDYPSLSDSYKDSYLLHLSKQDLQNANANLIFLRDSSARIRPEKIKPTSSYTSDDFQIRVGKWQ
jgi:hypothetical protein